MNTDKSIGAPAPLDSSALGCRAPLVFANTPSCLVALFLAIFCTLFFPPRAHAQVTVTLDAGRNANPFFATENGTAANGLTLRIGTFNSASNAEIQALGYNLLWVNNQFTVMDPEGGLSTGTVSGQAGSFSSDGETYADWFTEAAAALNRSIWLVYSNDGTLSSSTQFGIVSSTDSPWAMPSSYPGLLRTLETSQIDTVAFGSANGTSSTSSIRTETTPATFLYWDSNNAAGLGGSGTWSNSNSQLGWTTNASGLSANGTYAWGTTSGTDYFAGAGLTAQFGGTSGTVTISGTVQAHAGLRFETTGYTLTSGTLNLAGASAAANTLTVTTGTSTIASSLTGSNGLTKGGTGALVLTGSNTYSGATVVSAGVLEAAHANALGNTSSVTVTGGSLLVSADDAINDLSITLNKGITGDATAAQASLAFDGAYSNAAVTAGALTLSQDSIIDLGTGGVVVHFASIANLNDYILHIFNWEGNTVWSGTPGGGKDQFYVDENLGTAALDNIRFYSGTTQSSFLSTGFQVIGGSFNQEILAVPEPETYVTAVLLLLGLGLYLHRQKVRAAGAAAPNKSRGSEIPMCKESVCDAKGKGAGAFRPCGH